MTAQHRHTEAEAVGAYVLGLLDDDEASRFEMHMAGCPVCSSEFDELAGLEPMLADYVATVPHPSDIMARPGDGLLGRLVDVVTANRTKDRHRRLYLVAAAAALIIGGPVVTAVVTSSSGSGTSTQAISTAETAFAAMPAADKTEATDATTKVTATVGMAKKDWGSQVVLALGNLKGPQACSLIAVSKTGAEQTVTTWKVPTWGYGIKDSENAAAREPLYMSGGTALEPDEIDHFEIRTLDGKHLVDVNV